MSFNTTHIGNINFIGQFLFTDGNGTVTIRDGYITLSDGYTGQPAIRFDNAAATGIYSPEPDTIGFVIDAQEKVILDQDGYLGINTSAPVEYLTVDGVLAVSPQVEPPPDATYGKIYQKNDGVLYFKNSAGAEFDLTAGDVGGGGPVSGSGGAGRVTFWTGTTSVSGDTDLFWNNTTKRLGIGNAAPTQDLDVTGTILSQLMIIEQAGEPELAFRNTALANNPEFNIGRVADVDGTAAFRILFDNDVVSERTVYSIDADGRAVYTRQTDGVFFDAEIAGEVNPLFTLTSANNGGIAFRDVNTDIPADVILGRAGVGRLKISGLGGVESGVLDTDVVLSQDGYLSISSIAPMPQFVGIGETYIGSALEVDGYVWLREGAGISGDVSISGLVEVDGYILPERDNIHNLGDVDRRWRNIYTGPDSFHIFATDDETEIGEERDWILGVNSMGDLTIRQSEDRHVFVTSGGQVGIGVSDPQGEIHVDGFGVFNSGVRLGNYLSETTSLLKNSSGEVLVRNAADSDYTRIVSKTIHLDDGSLAEPSLSFINSTGTGIYRPANNTLGFVIANLEQVRIHPSGVISIGSTTAPTPPVKVSITGGGISADGSSIFGAGTVNERVTVSGRLSLQETTIPTNTSGYGKLYVSSADNDLHYLDSSGVDINLTADGGDITAFDGYAGRIPYFSSTSVLRGDKDFIWDPVNERLGIATTAPQAKIEIQDGYVDSFLKTPAIQITGGAQSGYVLTSGADGYASWAPAFSETTFNENKNFWNDSISTIRKDLDGYSTSGELQGIVNTELEHTIQTSEVFKTILKDLDGYQAQIDGLDTTEQEHHKQHSDAIGHILASLDGYSGSLDLTGLVNTVEEHKVFTTTSIESIVKDLDGYALSSDLAGLSTTVEENKTATDGDIKAIIDVIDGYATDADISGLVTTVEEHKAFATTSFESIVKDLDGYQSQIDGLSVTEQEHHQQHSEALGHILSSLDGYSGSLDLTGLVTTVEEHKVFTTTSLESIVKDLDGYALNTDLVGLGITVEENKAATDGDIKAIIDVIDGYATDADISGLITTEAEHHQQHSDAIQTILKDLDGYSTTGFGEGADGYIAFFTGPNGLAGDNDLFWDRENNRLGLHTQTPQNFLDIAGSAAIGSTYAGANVAPADGLLVEGQIGVGITSPASGIGNKLHLVASSTTGAAAATGDAVIIDNGIGSALINFRGNAGSTGTYGLYFSDDLRGAGSLEYIHSLEAMAFRSGGNARVGFHNAGVILGNGLGYTAPANRLDVSGAVAIGSTFATVSTAPADGLLVEGQTRLGQDISITDGRLIVGRNSSSPNGIIVNNSGTGDSFFGVALAGTTLWSIGADNDDSDKLKIVSGANPSAFPDRGLTLDITGSVTRLGVNTSNPDAPIDATRVSVAENSETILRIGQTLSGGGNPGVNFGPKILFVADSTTGSTGMGILRMAWDNPTGSGLEEARFRIDLKTGVDIFTHNVLNLNKYGLSLLKEDILPRSALDVGGDGYFDGYVVADHFRLPELGIPPTSVLEHGLIYVKEDGKLYFLDSSSTEFDLTAAASQVTATQGFDGYVTFFTDSQTIAGDNDLFWDRENNRLGIHTTVPKNFLDVAGGVAIGSTFAGVETTDTDGLLVEGNVKIGATTVITAITGAVPLVVSSSATSNMIVVNNDSTGDAWFGAATGGVVDWAWGVDNSDSNKFRLVPGSNPSNNPTSVVGITGQVGGSNSEFGINNRFPNAPMHAVKVNTASTTQGFIGVSTGARNNSPAGVGFGAGYSFTADDAINSLATQGTIYAKWENPAPASRTSRMEFEIVENNASEHIMLINKDGVAIFGDQVAPQSALDVAGDGYFDGYVVANHFRLPELGIPPLAVNEHGLVYVKEDGKLYFLDSASTEYDLTAAASQVTATQGFDGYVTFFTDSQTIAGDNDLFWDRVNNRLGIHTTNPQNFLDVAGGVVIGSTYAGASTAAEDGLFVEGKVSIGTAAPIASSNFEVFNTTGLPAFFNSDSTVRTQVTINNAATGDPRLSFAVLSASRAIIDYDQSEHSMVFRAGLATGSPSDKKQLILRGDNDYVGIQTLTPEANLDVRGDGYFDGYLNPFNTSMWGLGSTEKVWNQLFVDNINLKETFTPVAATGFGRLYVSESDNNLHYIDSSGVDFDLTPDGQSVGATQGADGYVAFFTGPSGIAGDNDFFFNRANNTLSLTGGGKLGIGLNSPQADFVVFANNNPGLSGSPSVAEDNSTEQIAIFQAGTGTDRAGYMHLVGTNVPGPDSTGFTTTQSTTSGFAWATRNAASVSFRMVLTADGRLGLNTTAPGELLHVGGITRTENIKITAGAEDGYVLISDADGYAEWEEPAFSDANVEPLTFYVDYNDGTAIDGVPKRKKFHTQRQIARYLEANSTTAFKNLQDVLDSLPDKIDFDVTINVAGGLQRPIASAIQGSFNGYTIELGGGEGDINIIGSDAVDVIDGYSGIVIDSHQVDSDDPWLDFSTTNANIFGAYDLRGWQVNISTGQRAVIHKNTADRVFITRVISPAITDSVDTVSIVKPQTLFRNSVSDTNIEYSTHFKINGRGKNGGRVFFSNITFEQFGISFTTGFSINNANVRADDCVFDFLTPVEEFGFANTNGIVASTIDSNILMFGCALKSSQNQTFAGADEVMNLDSDSLGSFLYSVVAGYSDGFISKNSSLFRFRNSVIDGPTTSAPSIFIDDASLSIESSLTSGKKNEIRQANNIGISFKNNARIANFTGTVFEQGTIFTDCSAPLIHLDDNASVDIPTQDFSGSGNTDVAIEMAGTNGNISFPSSLSLTGTAGDIRLQDGTIISYSDFTTADIVEDQAGNTIKKV